MARAAVEWRIVLWLTMAIHTPTHGHAGILFHHLHGFDGSVTSLARLASFNVSRVIKFDVIRQEMNLLPSDGFTLVVGLGDHVDILLRLGSHLNAHMTIHTDVETWNCRMPRDFHLRVAVLTVNFVLSRMEIMRKRNWLFRRISLVVTNNYFVIGENINKGHQATTDKYQQRESDDFFTHRQTHKVELKLAESFNFQERYL